MPCPCMASTETYMPSLCANPCPTCLYILLLALMSVK